MNVHYESCDSAPETEPMNALLGEYYDLMVSRVTAMGGLAPDGGQQANDEFWKEVELFLPPSGRLMLAKTDDGSLLGCGSLKTIGLDNGELKRLFVRPTARGLGIGRKLVELRIDAARKMGLKKLFVDTLKNNVEMRGLYGKLGFVEIDVYPESATYQLLPGLLPHMCFYSIEI